MQQTKHQWNNGEHLQLACGRLVQGLGLGLETAGLEGYTAGLGLERDWVEGLVEGIRVGIGVRLGLGLEG